MNKSVLVCGVIILGLALFGCQGKDDNRTASEKAGQKCTADDTNKDKELARMFLRGAQNGDKKMMYVATNLTTSLVDDSRNKLVHPAQSKQTNEQRTVSEAVLRISGEIDYFSGKIRKLFPQSAVIQITGTKTIGETAGTRRSEHFVTITYNDRAEALSDKAGRPVKVMVVHLQQTTSAIDGRVIHSFSFDGKGFNRFVEKDFEVVSYY